MFLLPYYTFMLAAYTTVITVFFGYCIEQVLAFPKNELQRRSVDRRVWMGALPRFANH